ncbi:hypothetical protein [Colwellia psychrerythraea]|nr:hypothetical protein [Colwellia psychrerythraea]
MQVPIKEQKVVQSPINFFNEHGQDIKRKEKVNDNASPLLNQQACRDNVEVTYRVIDQNAVSGMFHAKVQAQGVILSLSDDHKDMKLRTTGGLQKT